MLSYLTPGKARKMGLGIAADVTDADLGAALLRASRRVNAICAAPNRPQQHDFRGGTIVNETHQWYLPKHALDMAQRQVWLWHWPIIDFSRLQIDVTNQQYVRFPHNEVVVTDRYLEIASLTMTVSGLFGAAVIPIIGLAVPVIRVDYTYGETFDVVDDLLIQDDEDGLVWRASNQWWTGDPTIYVDGVASADGTVDMDEGTVTFGSPITGVVTADYTHRLDPDIAEATGLLARQELELTSQSQSLSGLQRIRVGEIEMERQRPSGSGNVPGSGDPTAPPDSVMRLLEGRRHVWAGS